MMQKIALVTGAGSGVGRASSIALNEAGFSVVLVGRRQDAIDGTAALIKGESMPVSADVSDPEQVRRLFDAVKERFGRLDVLFNNAGVNAPAVPIEELGVDHFQRVMAVNVGGAFNCSQAAFRLMKTQTPRGGRIINNGSLSAQVPRPNTAPYTASKHAITGLTKSLSLDGRPFDITCGQIDIGNAATEMTERMTKGVLQANGTLAQEPRIDADHIARAVVYMATLPLDVAVPFITVMAAQMPFAGRG